METETEEFPESSEDARRLGLRTVLIVPLMRQGLAIGTINLRRTEALLFTERQVALLQIFAGQAVIAIENVRLFTEVEARNRDLTATGEILRPPVPEVLSQRDAVDAERPTLPSRKE